jgi:hypothetical protein
MTGHRATAPKKPYFGRRGTGDRPHQAAQVARPNVPQGAVTAAGSLVLASVGASEGWWEARVLEVHDDLLTLRWRDCPDEPSFVRRKSQIALLVPGNYKIVID